MRNYGANVQDEHLSLQDLQAPSPLYCINAETRRSSSAAIQERQAFLEIEKFGTPRLGGRYEEVWRVNVSALCDAKAYCAMHTGMDRVTRRLIWVERMKGAFWLFPHSVTMKLHVPFIGGHA
ncbi:unnamed protein product [Ixodes persulcatus]